MDVLGMYSPSDRHNKRLCCDSENVVLFSAGVERLKVMQRSLSDRSNISGARCADCGNCTLTATTGGQIFLSGKPSNCPPLPVPHTWVIHSGRDGHVVQLTVERHLLAAVPAPETQQFELKVRDAWEVGCTYINKRLPVMWCLEALPRLEAASRQNFHFLGLGLD